jgi:hypothetical protein
MIEIAREAHISRIFRNSAHWVHSGLATAGSCETLDIVTSFFGSSLARGGQECLRETP